MLICIFLLLNIIIFHILRQNKPYQWQVLLFGLATAPSIFTSPTKPVLFLCLHTCFHVMIHLDDILICSQHAGKSAWSII